MSSISSASSLAQVEAAYDDNASYAEDGSAAKARAFVTAGRILLRRIPASAGGKETNVQFRVDLIEKQIGEAQAWLDANGGTAEDGGTGASAAGPRVTLADFRNLR